MKFICPHCKRGIDHYEDVDCFDADYNYLPKELIVIVDCVGVCQYCNEDIQWRETYNLYSVEDTTRIEGK